MFKILVLEDSDGNTVIPSSDQNEWRKTIKHVGPRKEIAEADFVMKYADDGNSVYILKERDREAHRFIDTESLPEYLKDMLNRRLGL